MVHLLLFSFLIDPTFPDVSSSHVRRKCMGRAIFTWVSKVIRVYFAFALLRSVIG